MKKADSIFIADPHATDKAPICRKPESFFEEYWMKWDFISALQKEHDCPVLCSGDVFSHWNPSLELVAELVNHLPKQFYSIFGNHDLPNHSMKLRKKCGLFLLQASGLCLPLKGTNWGEQPKRSSITIKGRKILVWHTMVYKNKKPYPGCPKVPASRFLKKFPKYDVILTGHNHQQFTQELDGRILVNPGSIARIEVGQIDFQPRVYLYYADTNTVKSVKLPIVKDSIFIPEERAIKKMRDEKMTEFIEHFEIKGDLKFMSFPEVVNNLISTNKIHKKTKVWIQKSMNL